MGNRFARDLGKGVAVAVLFDFFRYSEFDGCRFVIYLSGRGTAVDGQDNGVGLQHPPSSLSEPPGAFPMQVAYCNLAMVTITAIYYGWRHYNETLLKQRQRLLRERVTYMLWTMASQVT
jgi:hypothetical protein